MDEDARGESLRRLEAFVGTWELEASFGGGAHGQATFEWILEGQFLVERADVAGAPTSLALVGVDGAGEYVQHYFDARGLARVYAMTFADGVWKLLRDEPDFTPLEFSQRFVGELSANGRVIAGRWETAQPGSPWEHDFDLTYRRGPMNMAAALNSWLNFARRRAQARARYSVLTTNPTSST
jgi:hypothetical protein